MDVLFLDANVLFSAAYYADSPVGIFWRLDGVELITSAYAADEARRNLAEPERRARLEDLLGAIRIVARSPRYCCLPTSTCPKKTCPS